MQSAVPTMAAQGTAIAPEVWRHISPARHARVNFRGTFKFEFDKYGALWREEGGGSTARAHVH